MPLFFQVFQPVVPHWNDCVVFNFCFLNRDYSALAISKWKTLYMRRLRTWNPSSSVSSSSSLFCSSSSSKSTSCKTFPVCEYKYSIQIFSPKWLKNIFKWVNFKGKLTFAFYSVYTRCLFCLLNKQISHAAVCFSQDKTNTVYKYLLVYLFGTE